VRTLMIAQGQIMRSRAVAGIQKEIETVGMLELARAICTEREAEARLASGDMAGAMSKFSDANLCLNDWISEWDRRYPANDDRLPGRVNEGKWRISISFNALQAASRMRQANVDHDDIALAAYRATWHDVIDPMLTTSESGDTLTNSFQPIADMRSYDGIADTIPPLLLDELKDSPWPDAPSK